MATGDPTPGKKLTWTENSTEYPVQVESAIRDGTGKLIIKYASYNINTNSTAGDTEMFPKNISDFNFGTNPPGGASGAPNVVPRIIQIYDDSGKEVHADVQVTSTQIKITVTDAPVSKTWTVRVTAW
jgi:hypothetical protein